MKKSGLADSPFFQPQPKSPAVSSHATPLTVGRKVKKPTKTKKVKQNPQAITIPSNHGGMTPRNHATMPPRYHDTTVETIRKAVKELGKEAATHRFTVEEKKTLVDMVYSYKQQGIRTSENEITRIAVNFIVNDYRENGQNSVLEKALRALNE